MRHNYQIEKIENFDELIPYSAYTEWCIIYTPLAHEYYSDGGRKQLFILIRDDMPRVKKVEGVNYPKDNYGLSLIAIYVDKDGNFEATSRWNALDEPPELLGKDELKAMLTKEQYDTIFDNINK